MRKFSTIISAEAPIAGKRQKGGQKLIEPGILCGRAIKVAAQNIVNGCNHKIIYCGAKAGNPTNTLFSSALTSQANTFINRYFTRPVHCLLF